MKNITIVFLSESSVPIGSASRQDSMPVQGIPPVICSSKRIHVFYTQFCQQGFGFGHLKLSKVADVV